MSEGPIIGGPKRGKRNPDIAAEALDRRPRTVRKTPEQIERENAAAEAVAAASAAALDEELAQQRDDLDAQHAEIFEGTNDYPEDEGTTIIRSGGVLFGKVNIPFDIPGAPDSVWVTWGKTATIDPEEPINEAYNEIADDLVAMALDLADRIETQLAIRLSERRASLR